jgi:hypothetical protein
MSKKENNKPGLTRTYSLKIVYNPLNDKCEFVEEKITDEGRFVTIIPNVNLRDYFDDKTLGLINESYEVGEA